MFITPLSVVRCVEVLLFLISMLGPMSFSMILNFEHQNCFIYQFY